MEPSHSTKSSSLNINAILALILFSRPCNTAKYKGYMHMNNKQPLFERLLDALAEIAVANPKEVMALAVCFHQAKDTITLYLSGNHTVSERTAEHLKGVWSIMGSLACTFATSPYNLSQNSEIKYLRANLLLKIYTFCYPRFRKRFSKWYETLRNYYRRLSSNLEEKVPEPCGSPDRMEDIIETLRNLDSTLDFISRIFIAQPEGLDGIRPRSKEWTDFIRSMDYLKVLLGDIQTISCVFDDLEVQMDSQRRFGPAYAVQRIVSFQLLADTIFDFTDSLRFPPSRYSCEIDFVILPLGRTFPSSQFSWPKTSNEWIAIRNALYQSEGYEPLQSEMEDFTIPNVPSPHISCECTLIHYLDSTNSSSLGPSTPPMDYIGLSKPPCYLSDLWLMMYNAFAHRGHYVMRLSDGKWPEQWVLPQIGFEEVGPTFLKEIIAMYCVHQAGKGKVLFTPRAANVPV